MKLNNLLSAIVIFFAIVISASAIQNGDKKIILHPAVTNSTSETIKFSASIISERLRHYGVKNYSVVVGGDGKSVIVSLDADRLTPELKYLITAQGEVSFYETYGRAEAMKLIKEPGSLLASLSVPEIGPENDPRIGCAGSDLTVAADNAIKSLSTDKNLRLMWGKGGNDGVKCLFAIATSGNGGPLVSDRMIESAGISESSDKDDASIKIMLKPEAKSIFAEATKRNMGKSIVIAIDGMVYAWPVVRSVIDQGQIEVTGRFTQEEILVLPVIFSSGVLPSPMIISE